MRDLKILNAAQIALIALEESQLVWTACRESLGNFKSNLSRVGRMMEAPIYAALTADAHRMALHQVFGKEPTWEDVQSRLHPIGQEMDRIMVQFMNVDPEKHRRNMAGLALNLNAYIQQTNNITPVFEDLLNSMLVQAWTSIEVLAQELHSRCRRNHIECFAHLSGSEEFRFQKLESIRRAYEKAFKFDGGIKHALNEQGVDSLCQIRNLLVHKAGIVDQEFKDKCREKLILKWADFPVGYRFEPDGEIVRALIDRNVKACIKLIISADKWLTKNTP